MWWYLLVGLVAVLAIVIAIRLHLLLLLRLLLRLLLLLLLRLLLLLLRWVRLVARWRRVAVRNCLRRVVRRLLVDLSHTSASSELASELPTCPLLLRRHGCAREIETEGARPARRTTVVWPPPPLPARAAIEPTAIPIMAPAIIPPTGITGRGRQTTTLRGMVVGGGGGERRLGSREESRRVRAESGEEEATKRMFL